MIRDQGDRQLDMIGRLGTNRTKSIGFQNERLKMLEGEIRDKERGIKKSRSNDEKEKDRLFLSTQQQIMLLMILVGIHI